MARVRIGDVAPELILKDVEGAPVSLATMWGNGRHALLIFLRHLAWIPWREHVAQVVPLQAELEALDVNVVAISFGAEYWARMWLQETNAPFPVLLDPAKSSYAAYGLESSFWRSWGPRTLLYYANAVLHGQKLLGNRGDTEQLGGNFIVDANGIIRFAYASRDPTDRPTIDALMSALHKLKSS